MNGGIDGHYIAFLELRKTIEFNNLLRQQTTANEVTILELNI